MIGEYTCDYLRNNGEICGTSCMRPEGCRFHYKAKKRFPCTDCGKPTGSESGRCYNHVRGFYMIRYINRLKEKAQSLPS
jgi:hypothetical protein